MNPLYVLLLVLLVMAVLVGLVVHGTVAQNDWGINLTPIVCPRCDLEVPKVRVPTSFHQAMWGGTTCPICRAELDKWGRERV